MKLRASERIPAPSRAGGLWLVLVISFWWGQSSRDGDGATTTTTTAWRSAFALAPTTTRWSRQIGWTGLLRFHSKQRLLRAGLRASTANTETEEPAGAVDNSAVDNNEPDDDVDDEEEAKRRRRQERWDRIVKAGQDRAIANKKKREPTLDKKRRVLMFYKEKQREKKKRSKVPRPVQFKDRNATLSELAVGSTVNGTVISLTAFGAYVDIGTECDGLLHVSQLSRETFVEHPKQVLEPGQQVQVRIRSVAPALKKIQLTMLDAEFDAPSDSGSDGGGDKDDGIPLEEVAVDDELWGELSRVTDYGAYVEVGARVSGFLHFMDHPGFTWPENKGAHPRAYMRVGDRVRVWVSNVDLDRQRIKLTAYRPKHLPGPRREIAY